MHCTLYCKTTTNISISIIIIIFFKHSTGLVLSALRAFTRCLTVNGFPTTTVIRCKKEKYTQSQNGSVGVTLKNIMYDISHKQNMY